MLPLSCSTICFRAQPVEVALDEIRRAGFESVDLALVPGFCDHFPAATASPAEREDFVALVRESGLTVPSVTSVPGHFNDGTVASRVVEAARGHLKVAAQLGAACVNLHCGLPQPNRERWDADLAKQAGGLKQIAREAAALGLRVTVEAPHRNGLCRTIAEALALVDAIDEPNVYHLLDASHVHAGGAGQAEAVHAFGRRLAHVHLRDARGDDIFHVPGTGEVDFGALFSALRSSGYDGACAVELESAAETLDERRMALALARSFLMAAGDLRASLPARISE